MLLTHQDKIVLIKQEIKNAEAEQYILERRARIAHKVGSKDRAQQFEDALLIVVETLEELEKELKTLEGESNEPQ